MRNLTTFRIGGRPLFYCRPCGYRELECARERCRRHGLPFRILGGGSNLLVDDGCLPFAVIHLCSPGFDWIERTGPTTLRAGGGVRLGELLGYCLGAGLGGLEFLAGIPGTLGGALAGNAGAWGSSIGERVLRTWSLGEANRVEEIPAERVAFAYRTSALGGRIVTEAELALEPRSPELIGGLMRRNLRQKAGRHPVGTPSAGCVFKNPPAAPAGKLLERCGMKGKRVGDAQVSRLHANFICNLAEARAQDVLLLMEMMREAVRGRFGIELEPELKHWESRRTVA